MAVLDLQEQERVEAIKGWWRENRNQILGGALIVLLVVGGWRGWQYYQSQQANEAATLYAEFGKQLGSRDAKRINDAAAVLTGQYSATAFAPRAALLAAQLNEQSNDMASAKTQLQWVVDHAGNS